MNPEARILRVQQVLGIRLPEDWSRCSPAQVLAIDGVGLATLNQIRRQLAHQDLRLRDDQTPEYWREHFDSTNARAIVSPFVIVIDNKERRPWNFGDIRSGSGAAAGRPIFVPTLTRSLGTGDYSIFGHEDKIAIERKSLADLYATLGSGRGRFIRELERLNALSSSMIIVETDWMETLSYPPPRSLVSPAVIQGSIVVWSQQFPNVHWWLLPGRPAAERWAFWQFDHFFRRHTALLRSRFSQEMPLPICNE